MSEFVKKFEYCLFILDGSNSNYQQDNIWLKRNELDEKTPWRGKMIEKLLLIVIIANP